MRPSPPPLKTNNYFLLSSFARRGLRVIDQLCWMLCVFYNCRINLKFLFEFATWLIWECLTSLFQWGNNRDKTYFIKPHFISFFLVPHFYLLFPYLKPNSHSSSDLHSSKYFLTYSNYCRTKIMQIRHFFPSTVSLYGGTVETWMSWVSLVLLPGKY